MTSRRTALAVLAATPAIAKTLVDAGPGSQEESHHTHSGDAAEEGHKAAGNPRAFSTGDFALLACLTDLIIPRTDTPGAVDAGVPYWIDRRAEVNPRVMETFANGFAHVNQASGGSFLGLPHDGQVAILTAMSASNPPHPFFKSLKNMTIDAYYSSREGLVQELGFQGNTYRTSFPGCTHPEHQS